MTKVLDLTDHEFLLFITSVEYDNLHGLKVTDENYTLIWEESYAYSVGESLEEWLEDCQPLYLFEIMYD
jgi:hypothetical protein